MRKKKDIIKTIIIILTIIVIGLTIYNVYTMYQQIDLYSNYRATKTGFSTNHEETVENLAEKSQNRADILENVINSVVGISKLKSTGNSILGISTEDKLGLGTGIIVSSDGYILSNSHVTGEKYNSCFITLEDKNTYKGEVVWADSDLDLSIIKINAKNLHSANLGNSDKVRVGEDSFAIGNPIGYEFRRTVTSGIISAVNRTIRIEEDEKVTYMSNLIQTDATINPGNSGGPLINSKGEVIGINTVKITSAEGIGFAIPINVVKPIIEKFIKKGSFNEASLGIYVFDQDIAQYLSLSNNYTQGIYVSEILVNGPSYDTELKNGDIITYIDNIELKTINNLREYLYRKEPGDEVILKVVSGKISRNIKVRLGRGKNY